MGKVSSESSRKRVVYVDLLRLLATFQMVQGHSLDAVLAADLRQGAAFGAWTWARGLTSVAFLFAAGLSFHLVTLGTTARFDAHRRDPAAIRRRVGRGMLLIAIGYLLHNPFGAVFTGEWGAAFAHAAIVDVLQCIGVSILILEALTLRLSSRGRVTGAAVVLAILAIGLGPLLAGAPTTGALGWATNYVTHAGGSIFPLFPWAGYLFAGVVVGAIALPCGIESFGRRSVLKLALIASGLLVASWSLRFVPYAPGAPDPGPGVLKLSAVVFASAVLAAASLSASRLPRVLTILAGETLVIYVVHIALLYGAGYGLRDVLGQSLSLGSSLVVAAAMLALSVVVGLGWHRAKAGWRRPGGLVLPPLLRGTRPSLGE